MLHARSAHAVVTLGDSVYAIAGSGATGPVHEIERFDGKKWAVETTLPGEGLNAPVAVALGGLIYVIGGFEGLTTSRLPTSRSMTRRRGSGGRPRHSPPHTVDMRRSCSTATSPGDSFAITPYLN